MANVGVTTAMPSAQAPGGPTPITSFSLFPELPMDVKLSIFDFLKKDLDGEGRTARSRTLLNYASVSFDWHWYFERHIYRRINLTSVSLYDFAQHVGDRTSFIEEISLSIELDTYTCRACTQLSPKYPDANLNDAIVAKAVTDLFASLSRWPRDRVAENGVELELGIYCPSDSEHTFPNDLHLGREWSVCRDPPALEHCRKFDHSPSMLADLRPEALSNLHTIMYPNFGRGLATIQFVKKFTVRRQTRRSLSSTALKTILVHLPGIETITYEPWREFAPRLSNAPALVHFDYGQDIGYFNVLCELPRTLKTLTLFEDFSPETDMVLAQGNRREPNAVVGAVLASVSRRFEELHASFVVDAWDFFGACRDHWVWTNLRELSLTDTLLDDAEGRGIYITGLLLRAGMVAMQMPKLTRLEIWNGREGVAGVFGYRIEDGRALFEWRGTWWPMLELTVFQLWEEVALRHTNLLPSFNIVPGPNSTEILSHADAIDKLGVNEKVIHPTSLAQIKMEAQ